MPDVVIREAAEKQTPHQSPSVTASPREEAFGERQRNEVHYGETDCDDWGQESRLTCFSEVSYGTKGEI